jgi:hypothetical protein
MIELPGGFSLRDVYLYRSKDDPSTFFYLPGEPLPETGPDGTPTLQLIASDKGAILQFGSQWSVEPSLLSSLKEDLSGMFPELQKELIRLSPAQISVSEVTLYLGDGSGKFDQLQSVKPSGFPPFTALFNITLSSGDKAKVISSLNGRQNILKISYIGSLPVEREAKVSISGNVSREISALGKNVSLEDALLVVESAILKGSLNVERSEDESVSQDLKDKTYQQAKEKAASAIVAMVSGSSGQFNQSKIESAVSRTETVQVPLESAADISTWFPGRIGADHIIVTGVTITEPDKSSVTQLVGQPTSKTKFVKLSFDTGEMPVAFVDLKFGDAGTKLVGPEFAEASLPVEAVSELVVRTNYTDGGPAFETRLPLTDSEGWTLKPEDLGLAKVVLDGSGPKETGSTDVRVRVVYRPSRSGKGTYDDRTIYFRHDSWTASWFLVTRSVGLEGSLEFDWRETTADGSVMMHPSVSTDKTEIKLQE